VYFDFVIAASNLPVSIKDQIHEVDSGELGRVSRFIIIRSKIIKAGIEFINLPLDLRYFTPELLDRVCQISVFPLKFSDQVFGSLEGTGGLFGEAVFGTWRQRLWDRRRTRRHSRRYGLIRRSGSFGNWRRAWLLELELINLTVEGDYPKSGLSKF